MNRQEDIDAYTDADADAPVYVEGSLQNKFGFTPWTHFVFFVFFQRGKVVLIWERKLEMAREGEATGEGNFYDEDDLKHEQVSAEQQGRSKWGSKSYCYI